jgi:D-serine dehydratase
MMKPLMSGSFTVFDERMADWQEKLRLLEGINAELSACAGFKGLFEVENEKSVFAEYLKKEGIAETMEQATHIVWATGGGLMPDA